MKKYSMNEQFFNALIVNMINEPIFKVTKYSSEAPNLSVVQNNEVSFEHASMISTYYMLLLYTPIYSDYNVSFDSFLSVHNLCKKMLHEHFLILDAILNDSKVASPKYIMVPDNIYTLLKNEPMMEKITCEPYISRVVKFCCDFHIRLNMPITFYELEDANPYWYEYLFSLAYSNGVIESLPVQIKYKKSVCDLYNNELCKDNDNIGFDIYSAEDVEIPPFEFRLIKTGLIIRVPRPFSLSIYSRSSLFKKKSLILTNSRGIIDYNYCGNEDEIKLSLLNISKQPVLVEKGERLTQIVIEPVATNVNFLKYDKIKEKSRCGFGKTEGYKI